MTKEQVIEYLKANADILNLSAIGRNAGFKKLPAAVHGHVDGHGNPASFPDKHLKGVKKEVGRLFKATG